MIGAYMRMAVSDMINRKKRTFLTIIGIFIGVIAVVSLITIGEGVQNSIESQFASMGTDLIMVMPGGGGMTSSFGPAQGGKLTQHDIDLIKKVRGVDLVGGMVAKYAKVEYNGEIKYTYVIGLPTDEAQDIVFSMQQVAVEAGQRRFKEDEGYNAVIGYAIAHDEFFRKNVGLGDRFLINDREFRTVSILESLGSPPDDQQIYIPIKIADEIFNTSDDYYALIISTDPGTDPSEVAERIAKKMRDDRKLKEGDEDFSVQTYDQLLETMSSVLGIVQVVLLGIAAISLIVGGVGIMNSMYTSVLERTNEIGIMKAIGARNSDIMLIFLFQAGMLGLLGGAIGCAIGIGMAKAVEFYAASAGLSFLTVSVNSVLIASTLLFSFFFGVLAGVLPARRALKLKIVDALQYE